MPTTEYTEYTAEDLNYDICRYCKYFAALYYEEILTAFICTYNIEEVEEAE